MPKSKRRNRSTKSKSGYFGVTKSKQNRYQAQIWIKGNKQFIGTYDTVDEAAKAYDQEAIKSRRAFSKLNFPKKTPVGYTPIQQALRSTNTVGFKRCSTITEIEILKDLFAGFHFICSVESYVIKD